MGLLSCFGESHPTDDHAPGARPVSRGSRHSDPGRSQRMHDWVGGLPTDAAPEAERKETVAESAAAAGEEGKPKTGMRRRGASVAQQEYEPSWARQTDAAAEADRKKPLQYLYFGEGGGTPPKSSTRVNGQASSGVPTIRVDAPPAAFEPVRTIPGRDASGFQSNGVASQVTAPMGYQNLTYGGAVQMDFSGTQGL